MKRRTICVLAIVVAVALVLGYFILAKEEQELTIASFDAEHTFKVNDEPILSLLIDDYGITDNTVWVKGTVNWVGRSDQYVSKGVQVSLSIKRHSSSSVDVEVFLWSGSLVWSEETIAKDTVEVPQMGGAESVYPQSFSFRLSAIVPRPIPSVSSVTPVSSLRWNRYPFSGRP